MNRWTVLIGLVWWNLVEHATTVRVKQGDTIRVDCASPRGSRARGREGVREWVLQSATSTRPSRERERGRTQDQGVVRRSRRLVDCKRGREHHRRVPSFIKDHRHLRRAHDHSEYRGEKEIVSIRSWMNTGTQSAKSSSKASKEESGKRMYFQVCRHGQGGQHLPSKHQPQSQDSVEKKQRG